MQAIHTNIKERAGESSSDDDKKSIRKDISAKYLSLKDHPLQKSMSKISRAPARELESMWNIFFEIH